MHTGEMRQVCLLFVVISMSAAATARADEDSRLPPERAVIITGDFKASLQRASASGSDNSLTQLALAPGLDYVLPSRITLGAQLNFVLQSTSSGTETAYGVAGRAGYFASLTPTVGLWPQVSFAFVHGSLDSNLGGSPLISSIDITVLSINAPFVFAPAEHFFIGIGPSFQTFLTASNGFPKLTTLGFLSTVGGWF